MRVGEPFSSRPLTVLRPGRVKARRLMDEFKTRRLRNCLQYPQALVVVAAALLASPTSRSLLVSPPPVEHPRPLHRHPRRLPDHARSRFPPPRLLLPSCVRPCAARRLELTRALAVVAASHQDHRGHVVHRRAPHVERHLEKRIDTGTTYLPNIIALTTPSCDSTPILGAIGTCEIGRASCRERVS